MFVYWYYMFLRSLLVVYFETPLMSIRSLQFQLFVLFGMCDIGLMFMLNVFFSLFFESFFALFQQ